MKTKNKTIKLKVKSELADKDYVNKVVYSNFADEISTDKFLNRIFYTGCIIVAILGIILLIVNLTR